METISNIATTATTTVSSLIYGDQTKKNETAGTEPVSGKEGKGTATEPYDQGNAPTPLATDDKKPSFPVTGKDTEDATTSTSQKEFLQLSPEVEAPKPATEASTTTTSKDETTSTGLPIIPLTADTSTSGPQTSASKDVTETTGPTGTTDKVWKDTPLDDISRSGAPGAGPAAPESVTVATPETTSKTATTTAPDTNTATTATPTPVTASSDISKDTSAKDSSATSGIVGEKPHHKSEPTTSSPASEEKTGKMSHLKEKLKDKLHIGSKDK